MKSLPLLVLFSFCIALPTASAQPPPPLGAQIVRPGPPGAHPRYDRIIARRHLAVRPRVVTVPRPAVIPTPATAPVPVTRTTETTTVTTTAPPPRLYNAERNVVVIETGKESRELPYVTVPVLFVKETAELLDAESASALEETSTAIKEVIQTEPKAKFDIEGHTSTDGTDEFNMSLSAARAKRVYDELTQRYGVPPATLSAHGYGENYPAYPNGTEEQMQLDRRVLVVRTE